MKKLATLIAIVAGSIAFLPNTSHAVESGHTYWGIEVNEELVWLSGDPGKGDTLNLIVSDSRCESVRNRADVGYDCISIPFGAGHLNIELDVDW